MPVLEKIETDNEECILHPEHDRRIRVSDANEMPFCANGIVIAHFPDHTIQEGSGTLVSSRAVITAAHVLYNKKQRQNPVFAEFIHKPNGSKTTSYSSKKIYFPRVYAVEGREDYGVIFLERDLKRSVKIGIFNEGKLINKTALVAGYPGDKPLYEMWKCQGCIVQIENGIMNYDLDTNNGESGSGVMVQIEGEYLLAAVHISAGKTVNHATLMTEDRLNSLLHLCEGKGKIDCKRFNNSNNFVPSAVIRGIPEIDALVKSKANPTAKPDTTKKGAPDIPSNKNINAKYKPPSNLPTKIVEPAAKAFFKPSVPFANDVPVNPNLYTPRMNIQKLNPTVANAQKKVDHLKRNDCPSPPDKPKTSMNYYNVKNSQVGSGDNKKITVSSQPTVNSIPVAQTPKNIAKKQKVDAQKKIATSIQQSYPPNKINSNPIITDNKTRNKPSLTTAAAQYSTASNKQEIPPQTKKNTAYVTFAEPWSNAKLGPSGGADKTEPSYKNYYTAQPSPIKQRTGNPVSATKPVIISANASKPKVSVDEKPKTSQVKKRKVVINIEMEDTTFIQNLSEKGLSFSQIRSVYEVLKGSIKNA